MGECKENSPKQSQMKNIFEIVIPQQFQNLQTKVQVINVI